MTAQPRRSRKAQAPEPDRGQALLRQAHAKFHRDRAASVSLARAASDTSLTARCLNLLADADRIAGHMDSSRRLATEALACARASADESARADAVNNLGLLSWHQGDFALAAGQFSEALALRERLGNDHDVAATCNNLSLVTWEKGDLARAMEYQQRSLAIKTRIGDAYGIGVSHLNLGLIYVDLGDWDKALESYFRALVEKERSGDASDIALCYNNTGEVYLKRGRLDRARFYLEPALALARKAPSLWTEAEVLGNLGEMHLREGNLAQARSCLEADAAICEKTDDREELTETLRRLAELDLAEGHPVVALAHLDRAQDLCSRTGARREQGNILRVRAAAALASGDSDRARALLVESVAVLRTAGRSYELALSLLALGRLEHEAGSCRVESAEEARSLFDNLGATGMREQAAGLLGTEPLPESKPESGLLQALAGLACRSTSAAEFCTAALELLTGEPSVESAAVFLRDGSVFRSSRWDDRTSDSAATSFVLEAAGTRHGTLSVRGRVDRALLRTPVELLGLGLFQVASRIGRPEPGRPTRAFPDVIGADTTLRELFETVERVAPTRASILILGESGTGKELVARAIHDRSDRRSGPFVAVNCAAIPETLLESELLGVEKGTATGVAERRGRFETAHQGTLFLDEVADMSLGLQAKLLRVLQERSFERVGGRTPVEVDVRVIAATNQNIEKAIQAGRFRPDLYYRLNVITLALPPLRERHEDIPALVAHFIARFGREYSKPVRAASDDCLVRLVENPWPGNVRELENAIERAVILCRGETLTCADLPPALQGPPATHHGWREARDRVRTAAGAAVERDALISALEQSDWVVKHAADQLGMSRRQLHRLMHRHSITKPTR